MSGATLLRGATIFGALSCSQGLARRLREGQCCQLLVTVTTSNPEDRVTVTTSNLLVTCQETHPNLVIPLSPE